MAHGLARRGSGKEIGQCLNESTKEGRKKRALANLRREGRGCDGEHGQGQPATEWRMPAST
ncbi:hypothetical protein E2562_004915 [Oryza meyeriana var. granulata]|uniref:Uncharacterized protein n=1 Tax=Oryza meyeriana var. granulata TaxID=110450 RepID=A0A6G1C2N1_9ORYZ|nr:hypothetical protein E2562_004915 [Oryza meyeriana var. granulata]